MKKIIIVFAACLAIIGCTKEGLLDYSGLDHTADWLIPLVKTTVTAEQVSKLNKLSYDVGAVTVDAPFIDVNAAIPPISLETVGPVELKDTDSIYVQFKADTAQLKIYITNNFPINIKAGTIVEIRNSINNNLVVFDGVIQNDIMGKGGMDSVIVTRETTTPWADNKLELFLVDFASDGSSGVVEDFNTYNSIEISLKIEVIHLNEVELYSNLAYFVTDTTDFKMGADIDESGTEDVEKVGLNLFVENGVPFTYKIKGYFLDANYMTIDSLYGDHMVASPGLDGQGFVIKSTIVEEKIVSEITKSEYSLIKSTAKYMYYELEFNSGPQNVRVRHGDDVNLHLTADIKTKTSL